VLGLLNGRRFGDRYGVDQVTANNTVLAITDNWTWSNNGGWGWDNPLVALGQIRNGWRPDAVVAMLLMEDSHNGYWRTGWNWQVRKRLVWNSHLRSLVGGGNGAGPLVLSHDTSSTPIARRAGSPTCQAMGARWRQWL